MKGPFSLSLSLSLSLFLSLFKAEIVTSECWLFECCYPQFHLFDPQIF